MRAVSLSIAALSCAWCGLFNTQALSVCVAQDTPVTIPNPPEVPLALPSKPTSSEKALLERRKQLVGEKDRIMADLKKFNDEVADGVAEDKVAFYTKWQERLIRDIEAYKSQLAEYRGAANRRGATIQIGAVGAIGGDVWQVDLLGNKTKLQPGSPVMFKSQITTGPTGRLQVLLNDKTVFTVGPDSAIILDEFIYDPFTDFRKVSWQVTKGVLRFVTGKVAGKRPEGVKVKLASGVLGFRGTDVAVHVAADGTTTVTLISGECGFTPAGEKESRTMQAGHAMKIAADGKSVEIRRIQVDEFERTWRVNYAFPKP